jgi:peroxiredoxin
MKALGVLAVWVLLAGASSGADSVSPRAALASLPLANPDGTPASSPGSDVLVASVWSSGCAACVGQLENLEALARAYAGDPQVTFLALNVDAFVGTPRTARDRAWKRLHLTFPNLVDPQARFIRTLEAWAAHGARASTDLPATVTMPALYVVDAQGHSRAELRHFRDTKPAEFVERYRPWVEQAKKGALSQSGSSNAVATTLDTESHDVGVSRGTVRLQYPAMTDAQIARTLPDVRRQLTQMFPRASDAQLEAMLAKVQAAMKKGEPVEFDSQ